MKRRISILSFVFILIIQGYTQKKSLTEIKADKLFDGYSYLAAIEKYEQINNPSLEVLRKLAESYRFTNNSEQAEKYYLQVVSSDSSTARDIYWYAEMLMQNAKYDSADTWKGKYIAKLIDSESIDYEFKGYYKKLMVDKGIYKLKSLSINSPQQDFGVAYYGDKVVFASSRQDEIKAVTRKYNRNLLNFLDMYTADVTEGGELSNITHFQKDYNRKYHEGPAAFSSDGSFIVFTRNNYDETDPKGVRRLKLFTAYKKDTTWTEPKEVPFNSTDYSVGHPSLSEDGKTLYFSSDMPGGVGGVDIYRVNVLSDSTFGTPINLGKSVNSEYDEMFPFIHSSGLLFFSSDGWPGLGGLDVFYSKVTNDTYSGVKNLGVPINSRKDDFSFVLDKTMKKGYLSSNRPGGQGDDDLYYFDMLQPIEVFYAVNGHAKDKKGQILPQTKVTLKTEKDSVIAQQTVDSTGFYKFDIEKNVSYKLVGEKDEYFSYNEKVNTTSLSEQNSEIIQDVILEKDPGLSLYCLITNKETKQPLDSVKIRFTNKKTSRVENILTTNTGDFRRVLENNKLNDQIEYELKVEKAGYLAKTILYSKILSRPGQYNIHEDLDIALEKIEVGKDLAKMIDIKPIYFDLSKYNIRPDAAVELDKIVEVMNENPQMEIELGSHTDCRSSAAFNMKLSDQRAKASAKYVQERITKPERIFGKGYGETQLVNQCECEGSKVVPCTEEEHQLNRRTEFKIIKN